MAWSPLASEPRATSVKTLRVGWKGEAEIIRKSPTLEALLYLLYIHKHIHIYIYAYIYIYIHMYNCIHMWMYIHI